MFSNSTWLYLDINWSKKGFKSSKGDGSFRTKLIKGDDSKKYYLSRTLSIPQLQNLLNLKFDQSCNYCKGLLWWPTTVSSLIMIQQWQRESMQIFDFLWLQIEHIHTLDRSVFVLTLDRSVFVLILLIKGWYWLYSEIMIPNIITTVPGRKVLPIIRKTPNAIMIMLPIINMFMNLSGSQLFYRKVIPNW